MPLIKKNSSADFRNILSLFSGSFFGQVIHIFVLPFLSLCFSKNEIGAFFLFQAIVNLGNVIVSLQSENAIVVENSPKSYFYFKKTLQIISVFSILLFLLAGPISGILELISGKSSIGSWFGFVPLALLIQGWNTAFEYLFTFEKKFKIVSLLRIIRPLLIYSSIFGLYLFDGLKLYPILITGYILGYSLIMMIQVFMIRHISACRFRKSDFSLSGFRNYFNKNKNILIFNTLSTGLLTISVQLPYLFISACYGDRFNAFYGMGMRLIGMPVTLLGQSIGQVYFQTLSTLKKLKQPIYPALRFILSKIYTYGTLSALIAIFFLPWGIKLYIGKDWEEAALTSQILLPWLFTLMGNFTISNSISVLGIQQKTIFLDLILFFARITSLCICTGFHMNFFLTVGILSAIGLIFNLYYQYYILKLIRKPKTTSQGLYIIENKNLR